MPQLPQGDVNTLANQLMDVKYGGQTAALNQAIKTLRDQYGIDVNAENLYGQKGGQVLTDVYNNLQSQLGAGSQRLSDIYNTAGTESGAAYGKAAQGLQGLNQGVMQQIQDRMNALGQGGSTLAGGVQSALASLLNNYQQQAGINQQAQANAASNIASQKSNALNTQNMYMSNAQRQGAQAQTDLVNEVANAISNLGVANYKDVSGIQSQLTQLGSQRASDLATTMYSMKQDQYKAAMDQYNQRLQNVNAAAAMNQNDRQFQLDAQKERNSIGQAVAGLQADAAKSAAEFNNTMSQSVLANQLKYANPIDLAKMTQDINTGAAQQDYYTARANALNNPQAKPTANTRYQDELYAALNSAGYGINSPQAAGIQALIANADQYNALGVVKDPYQYAAQQAPLQPELKGIDPALIQKFLSTYYKGQ
jgi:hypothetical protein